MTANELKIRQLKYLINQTHKHGVKLSEEIRALEAKGRHGVTVHAKKALLKGLEVLNARRRKELDKLEHAFPVPKPTPKPKPQPKPQPKPKRFTMYDSTNVGNIPADAVAVAGYVDGSWPTFHDLVIKFPHAKALSITINSGTYADCLDIETGNATPADAPGWVRRQHAVGDKTPWVYANTSTMPQVIDALTKDSIKRSEYRVFTAHYTNVPHIEAGSDATQFEDHQELYDRSLCEPYLL